MPQVRLQSYRKWLKSVNTTPQARRIIADALDCYERIHKRKAIRPADLRSIVNAAMSRFRAAWFTGTDLLTSLSARHPAAAEAMKNAAKSTNGDDRFHIISSLDGSVPRSISLLLVKAALRDRSASVRAKAAEAADRLYLKELIPDLRACLAAEKNSKTNEAFNFHLEMLDRGYLVKKSATGTRIMVRVKRGWAGRAIPQCDADYPRVLLKHVRELIRRDERLFGSRPANGT